MTNLGPGGARNLPRVVLVTALSDISRPSNILHTFTSLIALVSPNLSDVYAAQNSKTVDDVSLQSQQEELPALRNHP